MAAVFIGALVFLVMVKVHDIINETNVGEMILGGKSM